MPHGTLSDIHAEPHPSVASLRIERTRSVQWLSRPACRQLLLIAFAATALCLADPSYAQSFGRINTALQTLVDFMTGTTGRLLAILGVAGLGIAAWFGRLSYSRAGEIIVGIAIVFGAAEIVDLFAR